MKKLYASLKNINTSNAVSQITASMIMIDDEADNASINTNKKEEDPTKINNYIRKILKLFARNTYVGFTATLFANVFISYDTQDEMLSDDLFPRHFIYSLESPSNYCGAQKYFFESNTNVRFIKDYDDKIFPLRHKKEWDGEKLFSSFYHSINVFLLANAIRDIREVEKNTHRSMLINMSRFTDVQFVIKEIVENYFAEMKRAIKQNCRCKKEDYMRNPLIHALYESFETEYADNCWFGKTATWEQVLERLPEAIKDIEIAVVNSSRNSNKLDYSKHERDGLRVIAIVGLALSRGLTLEGLCVSYFYRNTATFDVLMQMGRWFGYRDDYGDLCKIYLTDFSYRYYREISQSIEQLKKDIRSMGAQGKRPEDYGIRVRNNSSEMGITAANKMRNTKAKIDRKSFYGSVFETGDLAEYLAIQHYCKTPGLPNLQAAPIGTQNIDAISRAGDRYSIKVASGKVTGTFHGLHPKGSTELDKTKFEYVIICKFDDEYHLEAIYELTWKSFVKHKRWHSTMKAWNIPLTKEVLMDAKLIYASSQE